MILIKEILMEYNLWQRVMEVKQEKSLYSPCGGWIHFGGLDDPEKIKSTDWNIIWMEEATEFDYNDFVNLKLRLSSPIPPEAGLGFRNRMFMSFNPIDEYHWIKNKIIDEHAEDYTEIQSNYRFNPFLHQDYVKTIEALEHQDYNSYRIFTLGEWGKLENLIYKNWTNVKAIPIGGEEIFGLDFGFINQTALIRMNVDGLRVGVEEWIYESYLTNSMLIERMDRMFTPAQKANSQIFADSAEPQRIQEIANAGYCIYPSIKEVGAGIDYVKRCYLEVKEDSEHVQKELKGYSYKTDKMSGKVLEEPIKFNDHAVSAIRYALYSYWVQYCQFSGTPIRTTSEEIKADTGRPFKVSQDRGEKDFDDFDTNNIIREIGMDDD